MKEYNKQISKEVSRTYGWIFWLSIGILATLLVQWFSPEKLKGLIRKEAPVVEGVEKTDTDCYYEIVGVYYEGWDKFTPHTLDTIYQIYSYDEGCTKRDFTYINKTTYDFLGLGEKDVENKSGL